MPITQRAYGPTVKRAGRRAAPNVKLPTVRQNVDVNAFGAMEATARGNNIRRESNALSGALNLASSLYSAYDANEFENDKANARTELAETTKRADKYWASQQSLKGKDAVKLTRDIKTADGSQVLVMQDDKSVEERTSEAMQNFKREALARLENERQRDLFEQSFLSTEVRFNNLSSSYLSTQREVFRQNSLTAAIDMNRNNYVGAAMSGQDGSGYFDDMKQDTIAKFASQGENVVAVKLREQTEGAHIGVIRNLINSDRAGAAYDYFDKLKSNGQLQKDMSPKAIAVAEAELEKANVSKQAITMTNALVDAIPSDEPGYKDKQLTAARESVGDSNPKLLNELVQRLKIRHQEDDRRLTARRASLSDKSVGYTMEAKSFSAAREQIDKLYAHEHYVGANTDHQNALKNAKTQFINAAKEPAGATTHPLVKSEAYKAVDDKQIRNEQDLFAKYRSKFTAKDYDKLAAYYRKGGFRSGVSDSEVRTFYARAMGIKKADIDEKHYAPFQQEMLDEMDSLEDVKGLGLEKHIREMVIREKEKGYSPAGQLNSVFDPGKSTTREEARSYYGGRPFMSEKEAKTYTAQLSELGLSTWGPGSQDEKMKWGLHSYETGSGPTEKYKDADAFNAAATAALAKIGVTPTPQLLRLVWLHEANLISQEEFKTAGIKARKQ